MNSKIRLISALNREKVDRSPVAVPTQNATLDVMKKGNVFWPEAFKISQNMADLAYACHRLAGFESTRVPFDINVEAEAMGCETSFGEMDIPPHSTPKSRADIGKLKVPNPLRDGRMPVVIAAVKMLRKKCGDEVPVIAAFGTPFEILSTVLNFSDITDALEKDEKFLMAQMELVTETAIAHGKALSQAGPDVIMMVDGTSQVLNRKNFEKSSLPFTKRVADSIPQPKILHICGNSTPLIASMVETGVQGLSVDQPVDLDSAMKSAQNKVVFVGNIGTKTLLQGPVDKIREEVDAARSAGIQIIAPGCVILPQTPLANLLAYSNAVKGIN